MKHLILTLSVCAVIAHGQTAPAAKPKPGEVSPDTVVMKVGGKPLTAGEVNKLVSTFSKDIQAQAARDPKQVMQSYFLMQSLASQALQEKLDQTSPVKEQLELERMQTLASAEVNRWGASIVVSDEDARKRYDTGKDNDYQQAKIRAIFIKYAGPGVIQSAIDMSDPKAPKSEKPAPLPTENEARAKVDDILKRLRGGADFAALAKEMSDDKQTAANGGLYPAVRQPDRIPDEIKKVVFTLKPGEISNPVKQPLGFYVIKLEERGTMPFDDAKPAVVNEIKQERFQQWMEDVRKPFEVSIEDPAFFGMKPPAPAVGAAAPAK